MLCFVVLFIKNILFFLLRRSAEGNINDVLIKTLAEAHANTNLKLEYVNEMFRKPQVIYITLISCHFSANRLNTFVFFYILRLRFPMCFWDWGNVTQIFASSFSVSSHTKNTLSLSSLLLYHCLSSTGGHVRA